MNNWLLSVKNGVHYKHDNLLMDVSRSMEDCLLDNCPLLILKFDNIWLKPCKDVVREIVVIGLFVILRNMALKFFFGL